MNKSPKDGRTRFDNVATQPMKKHRVFTNPDVVSEGWVPVCPSRQIKMGKARSFKLGFQRIVLFRGESGNVAALDAFCPHMGADLGNGTVVGNQLRCYFHHWCFDKDGVLTKTPSAKKPELCQKSWPCQEKYGFIWVYPATKAPYAVPSPLGLEGEPLSSWHIGRVTLYAHHHVAIVGGIDLQHFKTVHDIDVNFNLDSNYDQHKATWKLDGLVAKNSWRGKLAHFLIGGRINYHAHVAGGSWFSITYGPDLRWKFLNRPFSPLYIVWGCVAKESGVSELDVFLVTKKSTGFWGRLRNCSKLLLTALLLLVLKDDDVKAFPYMRFNMGHLCQEDYSVSRMVRYFNKLPISIWSKTGDRS